MRQFGEGSEETGWKKGRRLCKPYDYSRNYFWMLNVDTFLILAGEISTPGATQFRCSNYSTYRRVLSI